MKQNIFSKFTTKLFFITLLLQVGAANAATTFTMGTVTGASYYEYVTSGTPTIYGGFAYLNGETPGTFGCSSSETCNTCKNRPDVSVDKFVTCNEASVFPTTTLRITATTSAAIVGLSLCDSNGNVVKSINTSFGAGALATLDVAWGDICSKVGLGGTTCAGGSNGIPENKSMNLTLREGSACPSGSGNLALNFILSSLVPGSTVGDDSTYATTCSGATSPVIGEGVCLFEVQEGDSKFYLLPGYRVAEGYPDTGGGLYFKDIVFFSQRSSTVGGTDGIAGLSTKSQMNTVGILKDDGGIDGAGSIDGFSNDVTYCLAIGNRNTAGNIYGFSKLSDYTAANVCRTPSEVVGILSDKKCFIATAAYGSTMDAHVETLRAFRNKFLFSSPVGRWIVKTYYHFSPQLANSIATSDTAKTITRGILWPLVWLADLSMDLNTNLILDLILIFAVIGVFIFFRRSKIRSIAVLALVVCLFSIHANAQTTSELPVQAAPQTQTAPPTQTIDLNNPAPNVQQPIPSAQAPVQPTTPAEATPPVVEIDLPAANSGVRRDTSPQGVPRISNQRAATPTVPLRKVQPISKKRNQIYDKEGQKRQGLYRVDKDGAFFYRTATAKKRDQTITFRIGRITAPEITASSGGKTYSFNDIYPDENLMMFNLDYEWQPWTSFGKFGIMGGFGFFTTQGNGRYATETTPPRTYQPIEKYTFIGMPLSLGAIYKLELAGRQWVVPYVAGGGTYYILVERRDDNKTTYLAQPAAYGAAGAMLNITALDRSLAFTMDNEYNIGNLWLTLEYRRIQSGGDVNMTTNFISAGIGADY